MTVLDTNIVIYLLEGRLAEPIAEKRSAVSVITEIELLSHSKLDEKGEAAIRDFLRSVMTVPLTVAIKEQAIQLRRQHGLSIPDAIVAATAVVMKSELFSNDRELAQTPGVQCRTLELKQSDVRPTRE